MFFVRGDTEHAHKLLKSVTVGSGRVGSGRAGPLNMKISASWRWTRSAFGLARNKWLNLLHEAKKKGWLTLPHIPMEENDAPVWRR